MKTLSIVITKIQKLTNPLNVKTFATLSIATRIIIIPAKRIILLNIFLAIILFLIPYEIMGNRVLAKCFLTKPGGFRVSVFRAVQGEGSCHEVRVS